LDRIRRVAVLTSGGDSSGLNACIRAVVRMAIHHGWEPWGVRDGFEGLVNGEFTQLSSRSVSHMVEVGGTFLGSSRSDAFMEVRGLREALRHLNEMAVDGLVVIGGDGSMRGARSLHEGGIATVGVPATIQNDVYGTDVAIGVDSTLSWWSSLGPSLATWR
jgi:6-phosphofructokinase 1